MLGLTSNLLVLSLTNVYPMSQEEVLFLNVQLLAVMLLFLSQSTSAKLVQLWLPPTETKSRMKSMLMGLRKLDS